MWVNRNTFISCFKTFVIYSSFSLFIDRNADTDPVETVNIEVYISYSPCRNCSNELIQIFGAYQKSFNLVFKIYYSNLYLYPQERDGLVNLLNRGVDLQPVIGEDMWKDFLLANGNPNYESFLAVVNSDGRIQRETRDQELFAEIQALTQLWNAWETLKDTQTSAN